MNKNLTRKYKAITTITEAHYELSALEKNIFYMLLAQLQDKDDEPDETKYYKISLHGLEQRFGRKISESELKEAAAGLLDRVYTVRKENGGLSCIKLATSMLSFFMKDIISLGVDCISRPYLVALKRGRTEYQLDVTLRLSSKYSKRMYEMLYQHREKGSFTLSVEELKYKLAIVDPKTGADKYPGWHMFSDQVLKHPKEELDKHADLTFTYMPRKTGRKFTHVEIHVVTNLINSEKSSQLTLF
jgi:plasmid replication initiation protein